MQEAKKQNIMRRIINYLIFSLVLLTGNRLNSQGIIIELKDSTQKKDVFVSRVNFGLRAGLNVAQIFGDYGFNHFGFSGGPKLDWRFSRKFSFSPEVIYNMKGAAKYPDVAKGDYYSFSVDLDYIEIPLLFNFHFGVKHRFSLEFGPAIGFLVRQKAYENGVAINTTNTGFNIYDISLVAGFYYYLPKGFALNFRYMNSIAPIQPTYGSLPWGVSAINIGQLNSVLNFSLQYTFDFTKKEKSETQPVKEKRNKEKKQRGNVVDEE